MNPPNVRGNALFCVDQKIALIKKFQGLKKNPTPLC